MTIGPKLPQFSGAYYLGTEKKRISDSEVNRRYDAALRDPGMTHAYPELKNDSVPKLLVQIPRFLIEDKKGDVFKNGDRLKNLQTPQSVDDFLKDMPVDIVLLSGEQAIAGERVLIGVHEVVRDFLAGKLAVKTHSRVIRELELGIAMNELQDKAKAAQAPKGQRISDTVSSTGSSADRLGAPTRSSILDLFKTMLATEASVEMSEPKAGPVLHLLLDGYQQLQDIAQSAPRYVQVLDALERLREAPPEQDYRPQF